MAALLYRTITTIFKSPQFGDPSKSKMRTNTCFKAYSPLIHCEESLVYGI